MKTRRTFLKACAAASALPLAAGARPALALAPGAGLYRLVADLETPSGRAFAAEARRLGAPAATPSQGVSALWSDDLCDKWKVSAAPIAGLTDHNTWFVLDMMAGGAGLRTLYRAHHLAGGDAGTAHEVFGPHGMLGHQAALAAAQGGWAARAARAVASAPQSASLARSHSTILAAQERTLNPGDLVSWVIGAADPQLSPCAPRPGRPPPSETFHEAQDEPMILPPGVSRRDFDLALNEFSAVVGSDWVFRSEEDLDLYRNAYTPFFGDPTRQRQAGGAVAPANVEQVQQIVRIANKYRTPLYAISTGRNLGYGGAAPALSGSVVVDLKRMNKVLEVNERDAYCLVEPGVSFIELSRYFIANNHPFMVSAAENGAGGPIGNALDHGCSNVRGDNFAAVCGMEVVLPNGDLLRTGSGAVPNAKLWQNYKYGFGPHIEGMFSQSNFGIVTKMGFWLERQPDMVQGFSATSARSDDLGPMIDAVQRMRNEGLLHISGGGSPLRSANAATNGAIPRGLKAVDDLLAKPGGGAASEWDALSRDTGVPVAMAMGNIRGPVKVVQAIFEHCQDVFAQMPGVTFNKGRTYRFPLDPSTIDVPERNGIGFPNLWAFQRLAVQGVNRGHYYFSPNILATAEDMLKVNVVLRKVMSDFGDDDMLRHWGWQGGIGFYPKNYTILGDFVVRDDADFNRKRIELFTRLVHTAAENGWAEYRTPTEFQDLVMGVYDYNNGSLRRFSETIKDAIDPNGIFSPGRGGIWPKRFRKA